MRRNVRSEEFIIAANQNIKEKEYWLKQLSGDWEKSSFPVDYQGNPDERDFHRIEFSISPGLCSRLAVLSKKSDRKLHIILAAGLFTLLDKYNGNRDIIIGTPIYKQNIKGDFINTVLVLRNQVEDNITFKTLVLNTKQTLVEALEHRDYPVEILSEQLNRPFEGDEDFPLFDVALLLENIQDKHDLQHTSHNMVFSFLRTGENVDGSNDNDNDNIKGLIEYNSAAYDKNTIIRISNHFTLLLQRVVFNADLELSAVSILSDKEKQRVLFEFNHTGRSLEREKGYCQRFEEQVSATPHRVVVLDGHHHLTYCQLNKGANQAACLLIEKGVRPRVITAVHMKRSINLLIFIIGIFKAGSTYLPLDTELPEERIKDILENPEIEVVITGKENFPVIGGIQASLPQAKHTISLEADEKEEAIFRQYPPDKPGTQCTSEETAYIIYTSGSTGKPKGVMIHHLGMINHLQAKINDLSLTRADIIAQTASIGFDISVWQFLAGLLVGGCSFLIDKEIVLQPIRLLRVLQKARVTVLETVPSLLAAFLDMVKHERDKDLKHMRWLIPTGEALTVHLVREWYTHFPSIKIMNAYGPTEASDDVTHYVVNEIPGEKQTTIPIGKPVQNMHIYILDRNLSLCPPGVRGEICTAGFGVGNGYWKDPEKTGLSFISNPFIDEIGDHSYAILYKTGDRGYFREDGQIVCLGRLDNQVKIRGNRIEPGEIENCLCNYPGIKEAVVTVIDDEAGDKTLCAYMVGEEFLVSDLRVYLQEKLPDFMIPLYFVRIEHMPLTPNGKVDRHALPPVAAGAAGAAAEYAPPRDETEKKLAGIWSEVLGGNREPGIDDNFFAMGGHSLKATILVSRIHKALDVEIPLKEVFSNQTIRKLAQYIAGLGKKVFSSIKPGEQKEYYPLSPAQKRLFILARLEECGTSYNIPGATLIEGEPDKNRLNQVFHALIKRHETLRTSFELLEGEPVQRIYPVRAVEFECQQWTDPGGEPVAEILEHFVKPFDLARAPLLRMGLLGLEDNRYILVYDMHHITADGTSLEILIDEFINLYGGRDLPGLRIQYKDFSEWQNDLLKTGDIVRQEEFWLEMFQGEIPVLSLSLDYPRPAVQSFAGDRLGFAVDSKITGQLKQMAEQIGATLYIVILAAYNILMARYAGQEDIIVGSHVAGRPHADLEKIIGMFVNPLPIRNYPVGARSLGRFLEEVKDNTFQAYENQDYPFEELLDKLDVKRDPSRNPLFDSAFTLITDPGIRSGGKGEDKEHESRAQGLVFKSYELERRGAKFDIILEAVEGNETIEFLIEYRTGLFKREKIRRMTGHFVNILKALTGNLQVKLSGIEILTAAERQQLLEGFNATEVSYQCHQTIPQLFAAQVSKTPHRIAVVCEDRELTYGELSIKSNQLARVLRGKGVKSDTIVGIMMDRSLEMVICILAILEAGGAYLPLDVTFPTERLRRVTEDCDLSLLLTQTSHLETHSFTRLQGRADTGHNPQITGVRPQIADFNSIPIPDRSMVDYEKYNRQIGLSMSKNCITMQATRGCPFHCAYCHKLWPKKHVARSAENIFDEVKLYYDMGIRRFAFIDDIFNLKVENSSRFLELIIKNKMDLQFYLCLRGDILSKDYIDLMVEAGVLKLALALETASPRLQKLIGKNLKIEKLRENTHYVCNRYPQVVIDLMTMHGFPTETEKEAMMTLDFIKEMKWLHFPYVHILKIYPNTEMERLALENGISRQAIARSANLAYHEIPETLPFDRSFTLQYQAEFTNEYFLSKERLKHVIPFQKKILTEDEFVRKYNSYLPVDIKSYTDFLGFSGISAGELGGGCFPDEAAVEVPHFNKRLKSHFPVREPGQGALRILLLDLSKYYSDEAGGMLYDVLEQPLGLMYLMTYLKDRLGDRVHGKIAKSRIDFNSDPELKGLVESFKPDIIGIRTLAFYKNFFHKTVALLRQWFPHVPIISGGPYATSDYAAVLQDRAIQLVVLGEGELTFTELIAKILENGAPYRLPPEGDLKQIPGIAFIPDQDKPNRRYAREIILADQLSGGLPGECGDNLPGVNRPGDLAYIMYTSGTTGIPKGVMTGHGNVVNVLEWFGRTYGIGEGTHVLQISDYTFDPSVEQIFSTLIHGGTFFILDRELVFNRQGFAQYIEMHDIQIINFIPSFLDELLGRGNRLKSLTAVIPGGEKLEESTKNRLLEKGYPLYNQYGPTETTIDAISTRCTLNSNHLGKPIANTRCYILDSVGSPVPIGVAGELYLSGVGVSRGYLNHPELTREKYQTEPVSENGCSTVNKKFLRGFQMCHGQFLQKAPPGRRMPGMYKTGDLVRWQPDGNIEFLGRADSQVKIRGHRIEPMEIEILLKRHPAVKQALVLLKSGAEEMALNKGGVEVQYSQVENIEELITLLESVNPELIRLYLDEVEGVSGQEDEGEVVAVTGGISTGSENVRVVRTGDFEIILKILEEGFIRPPREHQRKWHIQRAMEEFKDDLIHLDRQASGFVAGSGRKLITRDLKSTDAHFDDTQLIIDGQQVMQDWQHPLMKKMAQVAAESHGDVLEIGFGMGISADYIIGTGVKSYTVVECNERVVEYFRQWCQRYPGQNIRLVQGKWQEVLEQLDQYDAVFFDTYPLDEEEYYEYVINSITYAEHFFPAAFRLLRQGGIFTYYTNEIDSFSRRHQRLVLEYFDTFSLSVVKSLKPPADCKNWWSDSMVVIKAVKERNSELVNESINLKTK